MEHRAKGTAILVGYASENTLLGNAYDPARDFSDLLAQITSADSKTRESAKIKVRDLARRGGWKSSQSGQINSAAPSTTKVAAKTVESKQGKRWNHDDDVALKEKWQSPEHPPAKVVSEAFGRSEGSILYRLVKLGLYATTEAAQADNALRRRNRPVETETEGC